jgi:hypothetical protein
MSKGPLPDYMQAAFRGKRSVVIHGIEYKSADAVPDKWRCPTREEFTARRELGSYVPGPLEVAGAELAAPAREGE